VATDIFRRATGLGGHLIVAFVAPVGVSSRNPRSRTVAGSFSPEAQAAEAKAELADFRALMRQRRNKASTAQSATSGSGYATERASSDVRQARWPPAPIKD
jgi:hypothetical protein